jgi:hypothetical protein
VAGDLLQHPEPARAPIQSWLRTPHELVRLRSDRYLTRLCLRKFSLKKHEIHPGANPTIASYNASVVNFYNATGSLARFELLLTTFKNGLAYYNAGVVAVNLKIVGLAPGGELCHSLRFRGLNTPYSL